jgi:hypothetical protein
MFLETQTSAETDIGGHKNHPTQTFPDPEIGDANKTARDFVAHEVSSAIVSSASVATIGLSFKSSA